MSWYSPEVSGVTEENVQLTMDYLRDVGAIGPRDTSRRTRLIVIALLMRSLRGNVS